MNAIKYMNMAIENEERCAEKIKYIFVRQVARIVSG
jgi:hypothetical protein